MHPARLQITPLDHGREFGYTVRVASFSSGVEDFDVLIELETERDRIKILCSSEWAASLGKTLLERAAKSF
jgi:hypothetical protein